MLNVRCREVCGLKLMDREDEMEMMHLTMFHMNAYVDMDVYVYSYECMCTCALYLHIYK